MLIISIQRREVTEREARIKELTANHSVLISQSAKSKMPTSGTNAILICYLLKRRKKFWTVPKAYSWEANSWTLPGLPWNLMSRWNARFRKNSELCILNPFSTQLTRAPWQESTYVSPTETALDANQPIIHSFNDISHWITISSRSSLHDIGHTLANSDHPKRPGTTFDITRTQRSHRGSGGYSPWLCCANFTDSGCVYRPSLGIPCNLRRKPQLDKRLYFRHGRASDVRIHGFRRSVFDSLTDYM